MVRITGRTADDCFRKRKSQGNFSFGVFLFAVPFGKRFFVCAYGMVTVENFRRSWDFLLVVFCAS